MAVVLENPWIRVATEADGAIVRYTRTAEPYPALGYVEQLHLDAAQALDQLGRHRFALLADMRASPLNNDPSFEKASGRARDLIIRDFARVAVLVKTAVGSLQINRHLREDGVSILVFQDEAQALAYLRREPRASERPPPRSSRTGDEAPSSGALTETPPDSAARTSALPRSSARARR